ncbi:hypothetical protein Tco_1221824 [Tanacetum coccineum]
MNEDYYHEQNSCYDSNSFGFDQVQPPQYTVNHPIFNSQNELLNSQNKLMEQMTTLRDLVGQVIQKKEEEKRIAEEQAAKDRSWKIPICYDDDEDDTIAITPVSPIEEPDNSLSMGDEHLGTIPTMESDKVIKSSVEDLVPIPSESEDGSELGDKVSHTVGGSNIPNPLRAPGDHCVIDLYADEFDDQPIIARSITEILQFRSDGTSGSNGLGGSDGEGWLPVRGGRDSLRYFKMLSKSSSKREHVRKDLLEKAKEDNKMQYEEKHKSHALKLKKEIAKETNAKILDVCTKYSTTSLLVHSKQHLLQLFIQSLTL